MPLIKTKLLPNVHILTAVLHRLYSPPAFNPFTTTWLKYPYGIRVMLQDQSTRRNRRVNLPIYACTCVAASITLVSKTYGVPIQRLTTTKFGSCCWCCML